MSSEYICSKCERSFSSKRGLTVHTPFCKGKKYCKKCKKEIHPDRIFCSLSCSNSFNKKSPPKFCLRCKTQISSYKKYCNVQCSALHKSEILIEQWLNGEIDGSSKTGHAAYVKKYLIKKYNNKCSRCGWGEINPHTGNVPLEVEHIDGNAYNNNPVNVTLICPNCQSLTKTYRGANVGNGRRNYLKKYYYY
ncbi:MAG TPA: hypothetical protein VMX17_14245 [Candidatus Glassbacteria bacterium]|nr:hypothetical protein [Candidatus Glassbacteria bacterium]